MGRGAQGLKAGTDGSPASAPWCRHPPPGTHRQPGRPALIAHRSPVLPVVTMYMSDEDGDDFEEVCLPVNLEDDGYNMIHTHDDYAAFILAGGCLVCAAVVLSRLACGSC